MEKSVTPIGIIFYYTKNIKNYNFANLDLWKIKDHFILILKMI